jgi:N-acetylglucosaminyl-diphospho-decaprenol L-rhamnosyltransferase
MPAPGRATVRPMASPAVVVAVVSWNTRDLLARCLESLAEERRSGRVEVWVVDNASTDGSAEMVRKRFGWVELVEAGGNLGFGRAVNLVAGRTESEWIAASNADVEVRPGAIDALLEAGARDPGAGAIAPRLVIPDGSTQHSAFAFPTVPYAFVLATGLYKLSRRLGDRLAIPGCWDAERARRVPWAVAAFLMVRRSAWDEVGGFDERQWMYAEDLDLGWRLQEAGWATRYEPGAVVDHVGAAATTQVFGRDPAPRWQQSTYGVIARRRGPIRTWAVALLNLLGAVLRLARASLDRDVPAERRRELRRWVVVQARALRGPGALRRLT